MNERLVKLHWGQSSNGVLCSRAFNKKGARYEIEPAAGRNAVGHLGHYEVRIKTKDQSGHVVSEGVGSAPTQVKCKRLAERHFLDLQRRNKPADSALFWFDRLFDPGDVPSFGIKSVRPHAKRCQPAAFLAGPPTGQPLKLYRLGSRGAIATLNLDEDPTGEHLVADVRLLKGSQIVFFHALRTHDGPPIQPTSIAVPIEVYGGQGRVLQLLSEEALAGQPASVRNNVPGWPYLAFTCHGPPLGELLGDKPKRASVMPLVRASNGFIPIGF